MRNSFRRVPTFWAPMQPFCVPRPPARGTSRPQQSPVPPPLTNQLQRQETSWRAKRPALHACSCLAQLPPAAQPPRDPCCTRRRQMCQRGRLRVRAVLLFPARVCPRPNHRYKLASCQQPEGLFKVICTAMADSCDDQCNWCRPAARRDAPSGNRPHVSAFARSCWGHPVAPRGSRCFAGKPRGASDARPSRAAPAGRGGA